MTSTRFVAREVTRSKQANIMVWSSIWFTSFTSTIISTLLGTYFLELTPNTIPNINYSLIRYFQQLLLVLWGLSFLIGALVLLGTVTTYAQNRQRDIALTKAIGAGKDYVYSVFMFTLLFLIFSAIITGVLSGVAISPLLSTGSFTGQLDLQIFYLVTLLIYSGMAYVAGYRPTIKIFRKTTVDSLHLATPKIKPFTGFSRWLAQRSPTNNFVLKNLFRLHTKPHYLILLLMLSFLFASITTYGYGISSDTAVNYLERGYGDNVLVITRPEIAPDIITLYSFNESFPTSDINYTNPEYILNQSVIETVEAIPGIEKVAPRSIQKMVIEEYPFIQISDNDYIVIGQRRNATTFVVGYEYEKEFLEMQTDELSLREVNDQAAIIGDTLSFQLFDDPLLQFIKINETNTAIAGIQIDPFANGRALYLPYSRLEFLTGFSETNAIWVKVNPQNYTSTLAVIRSLKSTLDIEVVELGSIKIPIITQYQVSYQPLTFILVIIITMIFVILTSYLLTNSQRTQPDYLLAWSIGLAKSNLPLMIRLEAFFLIIYAAPIGIILGFVTAYVFLITNPILTNLTFGIITLFMIIFPSLLIQTMKFVGSWLFRSPSPFVTKN